MMLSTRNGRSGWTISSRSLFRSVPSARAAGGCGSKAGPGRRRALAEAPEVDQGVGDVGGIEARQLLGRPVLLDLGGELGLRRGQRLLPRRAPEGRNQTFRIELRSPWGQVLHRPWEFLANFWRQPSPFGPGFNRNREKAQYLTKKNRSADTEAPPVGGNRRRGPAGGRRAVPHRTLQKIGSASRGVGMGGCRQDLDRKAIWDFKSPRPTFCREAVRPFFFRAVSLRRPAACDPGRRRWGRRPRTAGWRSSACRRTGP
jgi:hypothetical protein